MLFTKCILSPRGESDGIRISVMSRHTLNDGVTPDDRITEFDLHMPIFGPSPRLIGSYYRGLVPWELFSAAYSTEMRFSEKAGAVAQLARLALEHDVTLLCIEEDHHHCHRSLLAEEILRKEPNLKIEHR